MKHLKEGVICSVCMPELLDGIITCGCIFDQYNLTLVITSINDGIHPAGGKTDPHYLGYAADLRSRDIDEHMLDPLVKSLKQELGPLWTVVLEKDHIHIQHNKFRTILKEVR